MPFSTLPEKIIFPTWKIKALDWNVESGSEQRIKNEQEWPLKYLDKTITSEMKNKYFRDKEQILQPQ